MGPASEPAMNFEQFAPEPEPGDVTLHVGSIRAREDGGLEAQERDNPHGWVWTDSPVTVSE